MLKKLSDLFLFMGLGHEECELVRERIHDGNRRSVIFFSAIGAVIFILLTLSALLGFGNLENEGRFYALCCVSLLIILLINHTAGKKNAVVTTLSCYGFMLILLSLGMYLAVGINSQSGPAAYLALLMALPALFCLAPAGYALMVVVCNLTLFFLLPLQLSGDILLDGQENLLIFGIVSIVVAVYMMNIKAKRFASERLTDYLLVHDRMTGLRNRFSYEQMLQEHSDGRGIFGVAVLDMNGLKRTNDEKGHLAGDELIRGAAECIKKVYGQHGRCFHMGGDEFVVLVTNPGANGEALLQRLRTMAENWRGEMSDSLSFSCGYADVEHFPGLTAERMVVEADKLMYADKTAYYSQCGRDRRRR